MNVWVTVSEDSDDVISVQHLIKVMGLGREGEEPEAIMGDPPNKQLCVLFRPIPILVEQSHNFKCVLD